jgi:predicted dehydrogenase
MHSRAVDRRAFIRTTVGAGLGIAVAGHTVFAGQQSSFAPGSALFSAPKIDRVRIGMIGLGRQGSSHAKNLLMVPGAEIAALCDVVPARVKRMQEACVKAGAPAPTGYSGGPEEWRRVCDADLDLVYVATPSTLHARMCIEAMLNGKHAAAEVPMCGTVDECWQVVEAAEQARRHCVVLENRCHDRTGMMILNIVRQRVLGDPLHAECSGFLDLGAHGLGQDGDERRWQQGSPTDRNTDLDTTHTLGPVSQWLDVNRGNRYEYLVSMSRSSRGLEEWASEHIGPDGPEATPAPAPGGVVHTLLTTSRGQTVLVRSDVGSLGPNAGRLLLQGTKGLVQGHCVEQVDSEGTRAHQGEELGRLREKYEHPLWRSLEQRREHEPRTGQAFLGDYRLVQCLREGLPTDMDIYDGATWSAVPELNARSRATRGCPVRVPDFTRGAWRSRPPLGIVT